MLAVIVVLLGGCGRNDPPAGMAGTQSAADRSSRAGADGSGDGPTALNPADKARAAGASASDAASTVTSSSTTGTNAMPTTVPQPSQGSPNAAGGIGQK